MLETNCPECGGQALTAGFDHRFGCTRANSGLLVESDERFRAYDNLGWICAKCFRSFAPHVNECPYCMKDKE